MPPILPFHAKGSFPQSIHASRRKLSHRFRQALQLLCVKSHSPAPSIPSTVLPSIASSFSTFVIKPSSFQGRGRHWFQPTGIISGDLTAQAPTQGRCPGRKRPSVGPPPNECATFAQIGVVPLGHEVTVSRVLCKFEPICEYPLYPICTIYQPDLYL